MRTGLVEGLKVKQVQDVRACEGKNAYFQHGAVMRTLKQLLKTSPISRLIFVPYRLRTALGYCSSSLVQIPAWLIRSREYTNFTYDLADLNRHYLAWFVALVTRTPISAVREYVAELEADDDLKNHVRQLTRASKFRHVSDAEPRFGRRVGWYAFVRILKPKVVVESGVDKGLGSCVLAAALRRNAAEGHTGYLYAIDIASDAGYLLQPPYANIGRMVYGDSLSVLRDFHEVIDLFIHDSRHSPEHEGSEYALLESKLAPKALVLSDNAHSTGELMAFAERTRRQFLFFREDPHLHWYPGGGIGAAFET